MAGRSCAGISPSTGERAASLARNLKPRPPSRRYAFELFDRMQHHDAVLLQHLGAFLEVGVVETDADMLKHADRHDAIIGALDVAIVDQIEPDAIGEMLLPRAFGRDRKLLLRQGHAARLRV